MTSYSNIKTVEFQGVSKRYRLGTSGTLRGALSTLLARKKSTAPCTFWALSDVSFQLRGGQSLGLIGPNGAGKTTTLKLLSNITKPTHGQIKLRGRVSSLIELGAGFHPELTGRDNVYLNGAILGLKRREIAQKLEAIIAFSGLERFIDTPVKRYSSGMYVRLGFAVAAHVEPDVLLVDEVLAVGDASFRHRCIQHMRGLQKNGTTVIFVSHNMHLVRSMCDQALLLVAGQIQATGTPTEVIAEYERRLADHQPAAAPGGDTAAHPLSRSEGSLILTDITIEPTAQASNGNVLSHSPTKIRIGYQATAVQKIGRIDIRILREDSTLCCTADSSLSVGTELNELAGTGFIEVDYNPIQLTTGAYVAVVQITDVSDSLVIASAQSPSFNVYAENAGRDRGIYVPQVLWRICESEANNGA